VIVIPQLLLLLHGAPWPGVAAGINSLDEINPAIATTEDMQLLKGDSGSGSMRIHTSKTNIKLGKKKWL
jgi:hypothetical protein